MFSDFESPIFDVGRCDFQEPGGRSALRRVTRRNRRIHPCPTCGRLNMLTRQDLDLGYQCDICADRDEGRL